MDDVARGDRHSRLRGAHVQLAVRADADGATSQLARRSAASPSRRGRWSGSARGRRPSRSRCPRGAGRRAGRAARSGCRRGGRHGTPSAPSSSKDVAAGMGSSSAVCVRLTPMPMTTASSPSVSREDPGELARSGAPVEGVAVDDHVVGPLERGGHAVPSRRLGHGHPGEQRQQARAGGRGPCARAPRTTAPNPGALTHARPSRPRPAVCSPATTTLPSGAPLAGQVEEVGVGRTRRRGHVRTGPRHLSVGEPSLDAGRHPLAPLTRHSHH